MIAAQAARKGWTVRYSTDDGYSAKNLNRPGITEALRLLEDGGTKVLVVAKLDPASRSLADAANLMDRHSVRAECWSLWI